MSQKYQKLALIGSGSFGKAWLVTQVENPVKMVSKEIKITKLTDKESEQCITEVMVLARCNHGNIVRYIEAYVEKKCLHIVMEYADGGDLQRKIFKQNGIYFTKEVILSWFTQIMMALDYIHSRNILHRDLKSQNVFLTGNDIIKLGDFGIAKVLEGQDDHAMTTIGTPFYISPEICQKKPYNSRSDMWAAGCLLFEMCLLRMPFNAPDFTSLVLKILQGDYDPIPSYFGPIIQQLVSSLLLIQPSERMSAADVLRIPEVSVIAKKHCLKHGDSNRRSPYPDITSNKCKRSSDDLSYNGKIFEKGQPNLASKRGLLNNDTDSGYRDGITGKQGNIYNKVCTDKVPQFSGRCPRERIRSVHNVRSLTPNLKRSHKVERQHSEPRTYHQSEKDNKGKTGKHDKKTNIFDNEQTENVEKEICCSCNRSPCIEKTNSASYTNSSCHDTTKTGLNNITPKDSNRNSEKISSKKTYVIKESVLRRLSQASPVLTETIRQQRASLSLDTTENDVEKVVPPKSALFSNKDTNETLKLPLSQMTDARFESSSDSENEVFQTQDTFCEDNLSKRHGRGERVPLAGEKTSFMTEQETGPFVVRQQEKRVDSTTYIVKSTEPLSSLNNNNNTDSIQAINEILFLAASVRKQNLKLAREILHDAIVSHLGPSVARTLVSMVTKHLESGQSYQSLINSLPEKEAEILPCIICLYNLS